MVEAQTVRMPLLRACTHRLIPLILLSAVLAGCSLTVSVDNGTPANGPSATLPPPPTIAPETSNVECTQTLSTSDDIQQVLDQAKPSDVICLSGGTYSPQETLTIKTSGENDHPITLRSAPGQHAIIDGPDSDPALELQQANWWSLTDLEITGSDILLRLNESSDNEITRSVFHDAGGECIRFRDQSQRNRFTDNVVYTCGLQGFNVEEGHKNGEGLYIGTAPEQRKRIDGALDHSNNNIVERNWFRTDGSEAVDIKEDSEQNIVRNNVGIGSKDPDGGIFGARGDNNQFLNNTAIGGTGAGFRAGGDDVSKGEHGQPSDRVYGKNNIFRDNVAQGNEGYGYRFMTWPQDVDCTNTGSDNGDGLFYVDNEDIQLNCPDVSSSPASGTPASD